MRRDMIGLLVFVAFCLGCPVLAYQLRADPLDADSNGPVSVADVVEQMVATMDAQRDCVAVVVAALGEMLHDIDTNGFVSTDGWPLAESTRCNADCDAGSCGISCAPGYACAAVCRNGVPTCSCVYIGPPHTDGWDLLLRR